MVLNQPGYVLSMLPPPSIKPVVTLHNLGPIDHARVVGSFYRLAQQFTRKIAHTIDPSIDPIKYILWRVLSRQGSRSTAARLYYIPDGSMCSSSHSNVPTFLLVGVEAYSCPVAVLTLWYCRRPDEDNAFTCRMPHTEKVLPSQSTTELQ